MTRANPSLGDDAICLTGSKKDVRIASLFAWLTHCQNGNCAAFKRRRRSGSATIRNPDSDRIEYETRFTARIQRWLDQCHGSCALRRPEIGRIVQTAFRHFDSDRYDLDEYVIMPNHVHVLLMPLEGHSLERILHSWKSYTAKSINKRLGRTGTFWMDENFDHAVRSWEQLQRLRQYIRENPIKAGLKATEYILGRGKGLRRGELPE